MAERRRNRKKKEQTEASEDSGKPSKEEYAIAKYMRQKLPEKKTMLLGHKVDYFIAARAIDCLLDSPWATKTGKQEAIFTTRDSCIEMMDRMLQHKFFHRAKKIIVQKDSKKKKKEKDEDTAAESGKEKEQKDKKEKKKEKEKEKEKEKDKETKVKEEAEEKTEDKKEEKKEGEKEEKKKEKRKIKLDMHMEQVFIDGNEAYVWIYDPIPMRTWIIGMLMVIGAVLVCLFPLWPQSIRHYIYYLSVAAAFFLVFIIGLAILRLVIFVLIWAITLGNHHLWLLPNLTEDVGFFESFWPLYHYEYRGKKKESKKEKDEEKKEQDKDESNSKEIKEEEEEEKNEKSDSDRDKKDGEDQTHSESEQDSDNTEKEKRSSDVEKEKNGDNGFELLDAEEESTQHSKH